MTKRYFYTFLHGEKIRKREDELSDVRHEIFQRLFIFF